MARKTKEYLKYKLEVSQQLDIRGPASNSRPNPDRSVFKLLTKSNTKLHFGLNVALHSNWFHQFLKTQSTNKVIKSKVKQPSLCFSFKLGSLQHKKKSIKPFKHLQL